MSAPAGTGGCGRGRGGLGRSSLSWRPTAPTIPIGPNSHDTDFFEHGTCWKVKVEMCPDEDDLAAVAAAKAVCQDCPVFLLCRAYVYKTDEYGVYAGETLGERTRAKEDAAAA